MLGDDARSRLSITCRAFSNYLSRALFPSTIQQALNAARLYCFFPSIPAEAETVARSSLQAVLPRLPHPDAWNPPVSNVSVTSPLGRQCLPVPALTTVALALLSWLIPAGLARKGIGHADSRQRTAIHALHRGLEIFAREVRRSQARGRQAEGGERRHRIGTIKAGKRGRFEKCRERGRGR